MFEKIVNDKLKIIDKIIKNEYKTITSIGVFEGLSGVSLFQFYYNRYLDDYDNGIGESIIEKCISLVNDGYASPNFSKGLAGFGWVLDHLKTANFIDIDNDMLLSNFDDYIKKEMILYLKSGNYDFLHAGVGCAYYFLSRYKATESDSLRHKYKKHLILFIEHLKKSSTNEGINKVKWVYRLNPDLKETVYDLSLAHGISSIIGILSRLYELDDFKPLTNELLTKALNYLLSFKKLDKETFSIFPNFANDKYESRVAWCYGDLGIGLTLLRASKSTNDDQMREIALLVLRHTANRLTPENSLVTDPYICHGAFGNSQIFNRIYKETKEPIFKNARNTWINHGLQLIEDKRSFIEKEKGKNYLRLLNGISGIGLVMIDYLSEHNSNWDECLMIN